MIRLGTLFWLILVSATGFAMFGVKYQVQALEDEAARTNRATAAEEHELRVLEAEWAYLTRPETLEAMNRRYLSLGPIVTRQLHATATDIPLRPPPALPPPELPAVVAAAEPATAANAAPSAPEGAPVSTPEPALSQAAAEAPATQSALRAMPALLEKPASAAQVAKGVTMKTAARPSQPPGPPRRAKSLDDLIAQIMTSR
jgi:cell division protein FtsL